MYSFIKSLKGSSRFFATIISTSSIYLFIDSYNNVCHHNKNKIRAGYYAEYVRTLVDKQLFKSIKFISYCDGDHNELNMSQIAIILGSKIRPIREKLFVEWSEKKVSGIEMPSFQLRAFKSGERLSHCIQLKHGVQHFDYRHAFSWMTSNLNMMYGKNGELPFEIESLMNEFKEFCLDANSDQISFRNNHGMKLIVTKFVNHNEQPSLQYFLFKESGFNEIDLDKISTAYESAFRYTPIVSEQFQSYKLGFQPWSRSHDMETIYNTFMIQHPERGLSPRKLLLKDDSAEREDVAVLVQQLQRFGVNVFDSASSEKYTWDSLAGYEEIKLQLQETILNAMQYPDLYDAIAHSTRERFESNRPKAVLLEGPPGTGKTLTARILASQCGRPLVLLNVENIVSKWYGEAEKNIAAVFDACDAVEGGVVLFIDEVDAMALSRDNASQLHEASRKILSVLLNRIEGFRGKSRSLVVGATNRKQDLDAALLSRFDMVLTYDLPNKDTRAAIFKRYAKQFAQQHDGDEEYDVLAEASAGLSCRGIKEVCEQAERSLACRLIEEEKAKKKGVLDESDLKAGFLKRLGNTTPRIDDYLKAIHQGAIV